MPLLLLWHLLLLRLLAIAVVVVLVGNLRREPKTFYYFFEKIMGDKYSLLITMLFVSGGRVSGCGTSICSGM